MAAIAMAEEIFAGVQERAGHALEFINPNRIETTSPVSRLNIRDGVRASLQLRDYLIDACKLAFKEVFDNRVTDYNLAGTLCIASFDVALKTFRAVARSLDAAEAEGLLNALDHHFEEEVAKFRKTIPELEAAREDIRQRWPWFDESRLLQSLAAKQRGEPGKPAGDAFREVRNRIRGAGS